MNIRTIDWKDNRIRLIEQRKLPQELKYVNIGNLRSLWRAIKTLQVRGAPALGAAVALGIYLGVKGGDEDNPKAFSRKLDEAAKYLAASRPTARNLFYGIERVCAKAKANRHLPVARIKRIILSEALKVMEEDRVACRKIGINGSRLIKDGDTILTICNAGALATIDYGTALGVIYRAKTEGKKIKVFASETRPLLQGSRLTAWELHKKGIEVSVISDNTAGFLMREGKINLVITGADRIAANGDSANKIGTFNLALLAKYHKIPFYIAAPLTTFDLAVRSGEDIPIEMRSPEEVTKILLKKEVAPKGAKALNPAFDVTPAKFITAIITDKGILRPDYRRSIKKIFSQ